MITFRKDPPCEKLKCSGTHIYILLMRNENGHELRKRRVRPSQKYPVTGERGRERGRERNRTRGRESPSLFLAQREIMMCRICQWRRPRRRRRRQSHVVRKVAAKAAVAAAALTVLPFPSPAAFQVLHANARIGAGRGLRGERQQPVVRRRADGRHWGESRVEQHPNGGRRRSRCRL